MAGLTWSISIEMAELLTSEQQENGVKIAHSLWSSYVDMGVSFSGKRLLDFGCAWGYLCLLALDRGTTSAVGVDLFPAWERLADRGLVERPGLQLRSGHLDAIEDIQGNEFDLIVSSGTLFLLDSQYLERTLAWFYDHLVPGGEALLRTRCVTAKSFNDLGTRLNVVGAQLLFSRKDVNAVLHEKGYKEPKSHLPYTGSSWIFSCRGAGFDVVNVRRFSNGEVERTAASHRSKTRFVEPSELATGEIMMHLRKPPSRRDLRALRKAESGP
jgi:hypothetical protein